MTEKEFREQIKFLITGGILEWEFSDIYGTNTTELQNEDIFFNNLEKVALQEINRYYDSTRLVQVQASGCIDLTAVEEAEGYKINSISNVYRSTASATGSTATNPSLDPMTISQWQMMNGGPSGLTEWTHRYTTYTLTQQIMNTTSTDLDFREDKLGRKLYVDLSQGSGGSLTIEYVPLITTVEEVIGNYWLDIFIRLSLAYAKIILGRIRTRYTQSNALWTQDGETMLTEGNTELSALRERLQIQANLSYPLD